MADLILPSDCWSIIFSSLTLVRDIITNGKVCMLFNLLVDGTIVVIDDNNPYYTIRFNLLNKWPNLHTINLKNSWVFAPDARRVVSVKRINIGLMRGVMKIWKEYWLATERTQEEFESISHTINYINVLGEIGSLELNKGTIIDSNLSTKISDGFVLDTVVSLSKKFLIKFSSTTDSYNKIARYFKSSNIGIVLTSLTCSFNIFLFLCYFSNVKYIEMAPEDLIRSIQSYEMYYFLEQITKPCNREIDINIPIYSGCLDLFLRIFPLVKAVKVFVLNTNELPQRSGVKITGYDKIRKCHI